MNSNNIGLIVALGAALIVGAYVMVNQASLDIAGPLRNWLWARDARRMRESGRYPDSIERSYWTGAEFEKDSARLDELGYIVVSQSENEPYVSAPPDPRTQRPPARRRVPVFHIVYERGPARSGGQPGRGDHAADVEDDGQDHQGDGEDGHHAPSEQP